MALFITVALVWSIVWAINHRSGLTLLLQQKIVTINIVNQGSARIIFSNAQPTNEIIYEMKSHWYPLLELNPDLFIGKIVKKPFHDYVKIHGIRYLGHFTITLLLALVIFGVFLKYTPKISFKKIKKKQTTPVL